MDGDRLVIHASTQVPWHLRRQVARLVGMKQHKVHVIKERVGGGFGSKQDILLEEVCERSAGELQSVYGEGCERFCNGEWLHPCLQWLDGYDDR